MLLTNKEILASAEAEKYAVGAFNIHNLESLQAVVTAAQEENSPVIVAVTPGAIKYAGLGYLAEVAKTAAQSSSLSMSLHLDHGKDIDTIVKCVDAGFTSVMIDGSHLSFEENIALTKEVVDLAHPRKAAVEAELGRLAGFEEIAVERREAALTDPQAAREFVRRTSVDALAVAIGTSHGAYKFKGEPKLDYRRLTEIKEKVSVPLVLHGASGVPAWIVRKATKYGAELAGAKGMPDESIKQAIRLGVTKINIDTDLRLAFAATVREVLISTPTEFDPRKILGPAREAMKEVVRGKMRLFDSSGRARCMRRVR
ncbi:MAG: class II fructose-1,6-bisphosphate aldolase [Candidatus Bathyarchaeota archaeon]|nr:MAG: class II fructose-1,6-bisphosphate aldolase [Candidatus Bathyarchaeota archaeon]